MSREVAAEAGRGRGTASHVEASSRGGPLAPLRAALRVLSEGGTLSEEMVADAFATVMGGEATTAQIGALLLGLRSRGETPAEVAGVVRALRRTMVPLGADRPDELVDTCGTGGGAVMTFNISTVAAFVAAGAGVRIAKHGNRSYTSRCGSADVLEALGIPLDAPVPVLTGVLAEAGIVFMFAPLMHPAMRHVAAVRRELGVPTVMNLVGPLANPAGAHRQVIGVADRQRLDLVAAALRALGVTHVLVVHGEPGLDEISPLGVTHVVEVLGDRERQWTIDPVALGLGGAGRDDLRSDEPSVNADLMVAVLSGHGSRGARSAVVLNAAAAIYVAGRAPTYGDALEIAAASLDRGAGLAALHRMREAYDRLTARHREATKERLGT
jgi:anthranilate phosphoribosyltransferase